MVGDNGGGDAGDVLLGHLGLDGAFNFLYRSGWQPSGALRRHKRRRQDHQDDGDSQRDMSDHRFTSEDFEFTADIRYLRIWKPPGSSRRSFSFNLSGRLKLTPPQASSLRFPSPRGRVLG
jgi:hypothetical protein